MQVEIFESRDPKKTAGSLAIWAWPIRAGLGRAGLARYQCVTVDQGYWSVNQTLSDA